MVDLLLVSDCPIGAVNSSHLKILVKGRGEAPALAKGAIRELDTVISLSQAMGVTIPVNLCVGMSSGYDCSRPGSIFWQLVGEIKPGKLTVFCAGGRYDNALEDVYKMAMTAGKSVVRSEMYCAGLSLDIDKLMLCLNKNNELRTVVDLLVYVAGVRPPLKEVTHILKSLWSAGIKCCFVEAPPKDDEDAYAKDLGASMIIFLGEDGCLRLKIWQQDHYFEKNVTRAEIIDYVKNLPKNTSVVENSVIQRNSSTTNVVSGLPMLEIIFVTIEKPNFNKRKRLENQIEQKLGNIMEKFNKKETFAIFAVELDAKSLKTLIGCIDPNPKDQSQNELDFMLEK